MSRTAVIERVVLLVCGLVTLQIGRIFKAMGRLAPTQEVNWSQFASVLLTVGGIAIVSSLLPVAWLKRAETGGGRRGFSARLGCLLGVGAVAVGGVVGTVAGLVKGRRRG